jgi:alkylhydroperoxidase/carboxymuconolactone decarboxylase family protein YurZ
MLGNPLETITKIDPQFMGFIRDSEKLVYGDGALPRRIKLLIAMAFDAAHGAVEGVRSLANASLKAGATKEEIYETLRVAYHLSGVGSLYTASRSLEEIFK